MVVRHPRRQHRPSAPPARRACAAARSRGHQLRRGGRAQATLAPVSVLRQPHDRHRDVPARLFAALPAGGSIPNHDQDRHVMIAVLRGNITNLRVNCAGSRPATKSLAVRATWATASSTNLCSTPVLPIVGARSSPPTFSIASAKRVQRASDTHHQRRNPHSVDARPLHTSRGFLVWGLFVSRSSQSGKSVVLRQFLCSIS